MNESQTQNVKRFWSLVDKSGGVNACWIWQGGERGSGYSGWYGWEGKPYYGHKFAYFQGRGRPYDQRLRLKSTCGNKKCVNWRHQEEIGKNKGGRILTVDKVRRIRYTYSAIQSELSAIHNKYGVDLRSTSLINPIAKAFGISRQSAYNIITDKIYVTK